MGKTIEGRSRILPMSSLQSLYCSAQSDQTELFGIQISINFGIQSQCMKDKYEYHLANITTTDIDKSTKCLRKSKSYGTDKKLKSDAIISSTDNFSKHVMLLFNSMITHGYIPNALSLSTMIPIVNNKHGDISSIDNYRAIALSNILGKLLDRIIINSQQTPLITSFQTEL